MGNILRDNNKKRKRTRHEHFPKIRYGTFINKQNELKFAYTKNPITKTNWEGKGVKPNIVCKSKDVIKCAIEYIN